MQKGDHWRDWEIIELLGSGSFGKVYRIRRSGFDGFTEESALKVIRIPQNDSDYQSMLKDGMDEKSANVYFETMVNELSREFTLMSSLKGNSNIVSFEDYEVNRLADRFGWEIVIRMELLEPLNESISKYGITAEEIAKVGIDICKALELCEKEKIIHRDIKPENIFVSKYGDYKLGDFGIAKKLENATYSHTQMGTLSYMAPEVYRGRPYNSTADIYSLGLVLYRLLNDNRYPFLPPYPQPITYQDRETAREKRMNGDRIPAPVNAGEGMARVILKACEYDPADRFQDAASMRAALEAVLDGTFDDATLPMTVKQTQSESGSESAPSDFIAKNKTLIGIAIAVLLVAAIAVSLLLPKSWDETETVPADEESFQDDEAEEPEQEEETTVQPAEPLPFDAAAATIDFPEYSGNTISVSSSEELLDAVKNATDGTIIEVASGNYSFDGPISINADNIKLCGKGDTKPVLDSALSIGGSNVMLENISVYITDYEKADGGEMARGIAVQSYSNGNTYLWSTDVILRYHGENVQKGIELTSPLYMENCVIDVSDTNDDFWVGYICVGMGSKLIAANNSFISNDVALGLWPAAEDMYSDEDVQDLLENNSFRAGIKFSN